MAKKLNLKKAPVRVPAPKVKRVRKKPRPDSVTIIPVESGEECSCHCWGVLLLMMVALGLMTCYASYHSKSEFIRGVGHGACTWELQKDQYPIHHLYSCKVSANHHLDVKDVDAWQID